jgi:hypothetical protein
MYIYRKLNSKKSLKLILLKLPILMIYQETHLLMQNIFVQMRTMNFMHKV